MRKEYNDRWNAQLVNPGFTLDQYEKERTKHRREMAECTCIYDFISDQHMAYCIVNFPSNHQK